MHIAFSTLSNFDITKICKETNQHTIVIATLLVILELFTLENSYENFVKPQIKLHLIFLYPTKIWALPKLEKVESSKKMKYMTYIHLLYDMVASLYYLIISIEKGSAYKMCMMIFTKAKHAQ